MERLTYRDSDGRALLTNKGMKIYCSTQATADVLCRYEEIIDADEKATEIRKLVGEIEDLAYWVHDYAGVIGDDEERGKMAEASEYLHILKTLIKLCPDDTLNKLHL